MKEGAKEILQAVSKGVLTPEEALVRLRSLGFEDLGFARVDHGRAGRCGAPEVVFCERKTPEQIRRILQSLLEAHGYALATRLAPETAKRLRKDFPAAAHNAAARTLLVGEPPRPVEGVPPVLVISGGTSDMPVAEEACVSAAYAGCAVERLYDAGVAGIHRLFAAEEALSRAGAIVAVAGMEGALPSVVGGLVEAPVIAVPTSVGYGASFGGLAALLGMLNSCAAGVVVVNIDNGFGAGLAAARILLSRRRTP
ncbi:MAG: nickel pincer cofactor biosynthesis protein LarB [Planctomycetota bacterium]